MGIDVTALKTDVDGDPGYVLSITNRTDKTVNVYSATGWTVKGAPVDDAVLLEAVEPGATIEGFLWFDHEKRGTASIDDLVDVEGVIVAEDAATTAKVGSYVFSM